MLFACDKHAKTYRSGGGKPLRKKELADKAVVTMFLMNGFQLHGVVKGFDGFTVILDSEGKQQLIYKHAISTVVPPKPIAFEAED